jgi:hypothetical protein
MERNITMDDVLIYHAHTFFALAIICHAHTFFALAIICVGTTMKMSTSIEHQLTKGALEIIIQVGSRLNPALIHFSCFALDIPNNFSYLWFICKHGDEFLSIC